MNIDTIREFCLSFPSAKEKLQWGDDLCFRINEKIFVVLGLDNARLCFKCTPEMFAELIEREDIRPAPYVGRYKWVMLDRLDAVPWNELRKLIGLSYEMVAAKTGGKSRRKKVRSKRGSRRKAGRNLEFLRGGQECPPHISKTNNHLLFDSIAVVG